MSTVTEIEAAVETLTPQDQTHLLQWLTERLHRKETGNSFPVAKTTGWPITQQEIDDASEAD